MATYSGLFNTQYLDGVATGVGTPLVFNNAEWGNNVRDRLGKLSRTRTGRVMAKLIAEVTGSAAGNTATVGNAKVPAPTPHTYGNGGLVPITTVNDINRATTAADITAIDATLAKIFAPATYPVDLSRNGGGSKLGGY